MLLSLSFPNAYSAGTFVSQYVEVLHRVCVFINSDNDDGRSRTEQLYFQDLDDKFVCISHVLLKICVFQWGS